VNKAIHLPPARLLALAEYTQRIQPADFVLETDICTIGRSPICQIIVQHQLVSRLHARIERTGPRYLLHDAGSANGTFVNGRRIAEPHLLADQELIGLGAAAGLLRFIDADPTFVPASRLRYDERAMRFYVGVQIIDLPPTSFKLLRHLYEHTGNICTRESCAQAIWGRDYDPDVDTAALDRIVANLRGQLRQIDQAADIIRTRRGVGYELALE
jgi:DNA-binding response OmpR family regulator